MSSKPNFLGRTYYYNQNSKETTWDKARIILEIFLINMLIVFSQPLAMASESERQEMLRIKAETKKFFEDMEHNIFNKIENGDDVHTTHNTVDLMDSHKVLKWDTFPRPHHVRTILSLDGEINFLARYTITFSLNSYI